MEPLRLAVLTVSDSVARGTRDDASGDLVAAWAADRGHRLVERDVVEDDQERIALWLASLADGGAVDVVLTTGGTGFTSRDVTPEATREIMDREAPGIAEVLRAEGARAVDSAWLSRGVAGIRSRTLVVNLPGSPAAVRDGLAVLDRFIAHAVQLLRERNTESHPGRG
ncbi:MAG TPA: MogA/MoaB family molybdenum cofactor biosynthesis protein [Longimicrobiales bacterium]|nr:MogA/MoaB family molybdenum cofactor biosynthesis protein [Longimicrobiales bacterium]